MTILVAKGNEAIKRAMGGWRTVHRLNEESAAKQLRMSRSTFRRRTDDPGSMTVSELRALINVAGCDEEEILKMVTGRKKERK